MIRKASPKHGTAVVTGDWDAAAQQKKLPSPMTVETAYAVYGYVDLSAADDGKVPKSACKLPHHNVSTSGKPGAANATALSAAIAALNGGRGGVAGLSDSERSAVYGHLAKHMRDADLDPPPLKPRTAMATLNQSHSMSVNVVPHIQWRLDAKPRKRAEGRQFGRRTVQIADPHFRVTKRDETTGLPKEFSAVVMRYGVIDSYWTRFRPGVFTASLEARMPRICWSHDWQNPIGRWTEVIRDDDADLELLGELDDFDAVPDAKRAAAQLKSGTMDQWSVGFYQQGEEEAGDDLPGVYDITLGELVEASPVVLGSVPGTHTTGMRKRSSGLLVPVEDVERILVDFGAGNLDVVDAINQAREIAEPDAAAPADEDTTEPAAEDEPDAGHPEETGTDSAEIDLGDDQPEAGGVTQPLPAAGDGEGQSGVSDPPLTSEQDPLLSDEVFQELESVLGQLGGI